MAPRSDDAERWVLMALIFKDLDDYDFTNALVLAERLFAIDNTCEDFRLLYAKCHYMLADYNAAHDLLKHATTIPCRYLYARTCLNLGHWVKDNDAKLSYWREGIQSLQQALSDYAKLETGQQKWTDDLTCISKRSHMPSESSVHKLMGEICRQMKTMNEITKQHFLQCLTKNRFKLSAYTTLCDMTSHTDQPDDNILPRNVFNEFSFETTIVREHSSNSHSPFTLSEMHPPSSPSSQQQQQQLSTMELTPVQPISSIRSGINTNALLLLCHAASNIENYLDKNHACEQDTIDKDNILEPMADNVEMQGTKVAHKHNYDLHKTQKTGTINNENLRLASPPQMDSPLTSDIHQGAKVPGAAAPTRNIGEERPYMEKSTPTSTPISTIELAVKAVEDATSQTILESMNNLILILSTIGTAYYYSRSRHYHSRSMKTLQRLPYSQYDTPTVLCLIGQAYYELGDNKKAYEFYHRSFSIAPWYCEGVPVYSTCLRVLGKENELGFLVTAMKNNLSHLYEAYIAAGNWAKCKHNDTEAIQWFQMAIGLNPGRSYGHTLLGFEDLEKKNDQASS